MKTITDMRSQGMIEILEIQSDNNKMIARMSRTAGDGNYYSITIKRNGEIVKKASRCKFDTAYDTIYGWMHNYEGEIAFKSMAKIEAYQEEIAAEEQIINEAYDSEVDECIRIYNIDIDSLRKLNYTAREMAKAYRIPMRYATKIVERCIQANEEEKAAEDAAYIDKAYEELRIDEIGWAEDHIEIVNHEQESLAIVEASHWKGIFFVSYKQEGVFNIEQFDNLDDAKMFARKVAINEANWQKEQRRAEYEAELAQYEIAPGVREIGNVYYINGREDEVAEIMPSYVGHNKVVWNLIRRGGAHLLFNTYDTIEEARQVARAHSICIHKLLNQ